MGLIEPKQTLGTGAVNQLGITVGTYHPILGFGTVNDPLVKKPYFFQGGDWLRHGRWDMTLFLDVVNVSSDERRSQDRP